MGRNGKKFFVIKKIFATKEDYRSLLIFLKNLMKTDIKLAEKISKGQERTPFRLYV